MKAFLFLFTFAHAMHIRCVYELSPGRPMDDGPLIRWGSSFSAEEYERSWVIDIQPWEFMAINAEWEHFMNITEPYTQTHTP